MKRAKFNTKEEQRKFFLEVKKKLGIGARKISKLLGLSSRGRIENYTSTRTSPPMEIVKKLEKLSGIKAEYVVVDGWIKRKKRKLTPLEFEEAKEVLKRYFPKEYNNITEMIEDGYKISEIINELRKLGYSFDNSIIVRAIGTIKTNKRIRFVDKIETKNLMIIRGGTRLIKGSLAVEFSLGPLYDKLDNSVKTGFEISKDLKQLKLFPLKIGRKFSKQRGKRLRILLPLHLNIEQNSNIDILIKPNEFGFNYTDFIYDSDGQKLANAALRNGVEIYPIRSTPINHLGDIAFKIKDKLVIVEITRANTHQSSNFKLGQCLTQRVMSPKNSIHFFVGKKGFFNDTGLNALKFINVKPITTDFRKDWEEKVFRKIIEGVQNEISTS